MLKRLMTSLLLLLAANLAFAQDLAGIWRGSLVQDSGGCFPVYNIEMQINFANNSLQGKSYDYYNVEQYMKLSFSGKYNPTNKRAVIIENKVLHYNIPPDCVPCIKTYMLQYDSSSNGEVLKGEFKGYTMDKKELCPAGKIVLHRAAAPVFETDIEQPEDLAVIQENLKLAPRKKDLQKDIEFNERKIKIELYDNAEIDGDTITVLLNNRLLLYKKMLTDKPLTLEINAFPDTDYELMMYADNLGKVPPNTAFMVITSGRKRFELHMSSSEEKSAVVRFRYVKE